MPKVTVCGENNLYVPETGCSECEELELRVRHLEECCADAQEALTLLGNRIDAIDTRLNGKQDALTAGDNVSINENNVISATDTTYSPATQSTNGLMSASDKTKLDGIQSGAEANVQADWDQTNTSADDYIKNKPDLSEFITCDDITECLTKADILSILDYEETELTMTDTNGSTVTKTILTKTEPISEVIWDGLVEANYRCSPIDSLPDSLLPYKTVLDSVNVGDTLKITANGEEAIVTVGDEVNPQPMSAYVTESESGKYVCILSQDIYAYLDVSTYDGQMCCGNNYFDVYMKVEKL